MIAVNLVGIISTIALPFFTNFGRHVKTMTKFYSNHEKIYSFFLTYPVVQKFYSQYINNFLSAFYLR